MTESRAAYPVRVEAAVEPAPSRALWLVKWLLLIPHAIVLAFLWAAFVVLTVIAFFAILFTARYPRALFDFNVGVLRWTWRVGYYGYSANGTDRYPPFTLADVPDYPAHLDVVYPVRLSRGLVLIKWWLLAIPQYIVVAVFVGAWLGSTNQWRDHPWWWGWGAGGLVGLLVFVSAVALLFSGRYPRPLYDFVLGMNRWALRVAGYASLMTDAYPPFRLDMGGPDPAGPPAQPVPPVPPVRPGSTWTAGRIVSVVVGAVLLFSGVGAMVGGGGLLWADRTQRVDGYLMAPAATVRTDGYAVTTSSFRLEGAGLDWAVDNVLGTARVEVDRIAAPTAAEDTLFVGIARSDDVNRYLQGVSHRQIRDFGPRWSSYRWAVTDVAGGAPATPPEQAGIWAASASGPDPATVTWRPTEGDWTLVVMRADGGPGVRAAVRAGATLPGAGWIAGIALAFGGLLLLAGALFVAVAVARAQRPPSALPPVAGAPGIPPAPPAPRVPPAPPAPPGPPASTGPAGSGASVFPGGGPER